MGSVNVPEYVLKVKSRVSIWVYQSSRTIERERGIAYDLNVTSFFQSLFFSQDENH